MVCRFRSWGRRLRLLGERFFCLPRSWFQGHSIWIHCIPGIIWESGSDACPTLTLTLTDLSDFSPNGQGTFTLTVKGLGAFLDGPMKFLHSGSHSKISDLNHDYTVVLFHIFLIWAGFKRIHLFVFRYWLTKFAATWHKLAPGRTSARGWKSLAARFITYRMDMPNSRLLFCQGAVPLRRKYRCCNIWILFVPFRPGKNHLYAYN